MQIDLGSLNSVAGVVTQGRQNGDQWVTGYTVSTSTDGSTWTPVNNGQQLSGNTDKITKVQHVFSSVSARYVRFYVKTWHSHISMRAGVIISGLPFTLRGDGGCNGRNEICSAGASPCSSAPDLSACENLCYSDKACVSFEWRASSSLCHLSTTCTNSIRVADNQGSNGWVMYERTGSEGR